MPAEHEIRCRARCTLCAVPGFLVSLLAFHPHDQQSLAIWLCCGCCTASELSSALPSNGCSVLSSISPFLGFLIPFHTHCCSRSGCFLHLKIATGPAPTTRLRWLRLLLRAHPRLQNSNLVEPPKGTRPESLKSPVTNRPSSGPDRDFIRQTGSVMTMHRTLEWSADSKYPEPRLLCVCAAGFGFGKKDLVPWASFCAFGAGFVRENGIITSSCSASAAPRPSLPY